MFDGRSIERKRKQLWSICITFMGLFVILFLFPIGFDSQLSCLNLRGKNNKEIKDEDILWKFGTNRRMFKGYLGVQSFKMTKGTVGVQSCV